MTKCLTAGPCIWQHNISPIPFGHQIIDVRSIWNKSGGLCFFLFVTSFQSDGIPECGYFSFQPCEICSSHWHTHTALSVCTWMKGNLTMVRHEMGCVLHALRSCLIVSQSAAGSIIAMIRKRPFVKPGESFLFSSFGRARRWREAGIDKFDWIIRSQHRPLNYFYCFSVSRFLQQVPLHPSMFLLFLLAATVTSTNTNCKLWGCNEVTAACFHTFCLAFIGTLMPRKSSEDCKEGWRFFWSSIFQHETAEGVWWLLNSAFVPPQHMQFSLIDVADLSLGKLWNS